MRGLVKNKVGTLRSPQDADRVAEALEGLLLIISEKST